MEMWRKVGNKQLRKYPDKTRKEVFRNEGVSERARIEVKKTTLQIIMPATTQKCCLVVV